MSAFLNHANRFSKVALFSGMAFLLTACVFGKHEIIQVAVQVGDTAESAKAAVLQLKDAHRQQVDAHIATRKLLKTTLEQSFGANNPRVVEGLKQIKATYMAQVDAIYADTVSAIRTEKKTALALLNSKIDEQMKELADEVNEKRQLAIEKKERQEQFPNDTRVELDLKKAQASYLALAVAYFETKYKAYARGVDALDSAEQDILEKLAAQRVKYRASIEGTYAKALENLSGLTSGDIDLGPEPRVPSGYDVVVLSQDSIKKGADQIIHQLQSSDFGKGSIFSGGFNAFAQGLISGAFASGNGAATLKDVKASGQALFSAIKDDLNQNLNDLIKSAREAMGNVQEGIVSTFLNKMEEATTPVIDAIKPSAN